MDVLQFGHLLLIVAAALTAAIFLLALAGVARRDRRFVLAARNGFYALLVVLGSSAGCLVYGFLAGHYNNEYIYNYSERHLPTFFKFAGLWAGLDGSLLFWTLLLSAYSALVAFQHRWSARDPSGRRCEPYVYVVLSVILGFFVAVTLSENVFAGMSVEKRLALAARQGIPLSAGGDLLDGHGLNPQLVNYWFVIHPPTLYLGFIGFTVPFAFTIAALLAGEVGDYWIRITRRWTMVSWMLLTSGIILGGLWAYRQLGWGGYWAWDPVENASFLPWCTGTAYLHSIMIQERRDMLRGWNVFLIFLTFFLTIVGTWMTRSGVVDSVHAFAGGGNIGIWFQGFLFFLAAGGLFIICYRLRELRGRHEIESLLSREAAFYLNNLVLLMIAAVVFLFSFWPKLSHDWFAAPVTDHGWFQATTPLFAMLLFLTAVGPGLGWVKTSVSSLRRNFFTSVLITTLFTLTLYGFLWWRGLLGTWSEVLLPRYFHLEAPRLWDLLIAHHPSAFYPTGLFLALSCFIVCTVGTEFVRALRARVRLRDESAMTAATQIVLRNNRRWGGYVVHLGIATLATGIVVSSMFQVTKETTLATGESTDIGPYRLHLVEANLRAEPIPGEPYWKDEIVFRVLRREDGALAHAEADGAALANGTTTADGATSEELVTELRPEGRYYPKQGTWINEVSIHRMLLGDIYVYGQRGVEAGGGVSESFKLTIYLNPLMMLIYLGWFVMIGGALFAALPIGSNRIGLSE